MTPSPASCGVAVDGGERRRARADSDRPEALHRLLERTSRTFGTGVLLLVEAPAQGVTWRGASGAFGPGAREIRAGDAFRIASVTKMITAATVLRLVEDGRIALDEPIAHHLPEPTATTLASALSRNHLAALTPRLLLQQRAGLADFIDGPYKALAGLNALPPTMARLARSYLARRGFAPRPAGVPWPPAAMIAHAARRGLAATWPGSRFAYADTNFVLLGLLVEAVCKAPLHDVYRRLIFDPLGMDATWLEDREPARSAPAHVFSGRYDVSGFDRTADWAGGGLVSTLDDLRRFMTALTGGTLFAEPAAFAAMRAFVAVGNGAFAGLKGYGLGLALCDFADEQFVGHGGMWGAFAFASRRDDLLLIGTTNRAGMFAQASRSLIEGAVEIVRSRAHEPRLRAVRAAETTETEKALAATST